MEQLIENLRDIRGVKAVRKRESIIEIELFSRPVKGDIVEIQGDLRKISQKLGNAFRSASDSGEISGWEWMVKPKKQYQETSLGKKSRVSDRKPKGHKPGYYRVSIQR